MMMMLPLIRMSFEYMNCTISCLNTRVKVKGKSKGKADLKILQLN